VSWLVLAWLVACSDPQPAADAGGMDAGRDATVLADVGSREDAGIALVRVPNATCRLPEAGSPSAYVAAPAYPRLRFARPVWVGAAPGDAGTMYVVEQNGIIHAFDDDPDAAATEAFLTMTPLRTSNEDGLLGLAFHPDYAANGRFFVSYSSDAGCPAGFARCNVVSEFSRESARRADPASERRLIAVGDPYVNHNGGDLRFGTDGYLYVALGDGGSGGDPMGNAQNTSALLGKILRVDVDTTSEGRPYGIPGTNPFAAGGGAPEVYVWGVRNPWRTSVDRANGALWIGDVGQALFEEIDKVFGPANLGWDVREGDSCYPASLPCATEGLVPPVYVYGRDVGRVVIGGPVYRGPELRELWGTYLFADYSAGRVYSLRERADMPPEVAELFALAHPTSFGEDNDGRVYIATFGGRIMKLDRAPDTTADPIPRLLSETGCFADTASHTPAPGVVAYDLNMPLWSDGAEKLRFIALPELETATPAVEGAYSFPIGTLFLKTFVREGRRIETRILSHETSGWRGFTWRWLEDQSDAVLLEGPLTEPIGSGTWTYPSRVQCEQCHTSEAGHVLGFTTRQLNRVVDYEGSPALQLDALEQAGFFDAALPGELPAHPRLDDTLVSAGDRARAYLDANCAMCHRPDGTADALVDLRAQTPLAESGLCGAPLQGDLGLPMARLVAPGSPERSVLHARVSRRGLDRMPPLATVTPDDAASAVIAEWIRGLAACP
jgi:uncharacterized repeat protein (TIGR03806 family)